MFWNGMFILWTFKNIDLIPISSDYKGAVVRIEGMSIFYVLHGCWQFWNGGGREGGFKTTFKWVIS